MWTKQQHVMDSEHMAACPPESWHMLNMVILIHPHLINLACNHCHFEHVTVDLCLVYRHTKSCLLSQISLKDVFVHKNITNKHRKVYRWPLCWIFDGLDWNMERNNKRKERGGSKRVRERNVMIIILPRKWPCPAKTGRKSIHKGYVEVFGMCINASISQKLACAPCAVFILARWCEVYRHTCLCFMFLCNYVGEDKVKLWGIMTIKSWVEASHRVQMPRDSGSNRIPMSPIVS